MTSFLDNNITPTWRWIYFSELNTPVREATIFPDWQTGKTEGKPDTPPAEIEQKAAEAVEQMGVTGLCPAAGNILPLYRGKGKMIPLAYAYGVHFTRMIDGIPVTYTNNDGTTAEGNNASWPYEHISLVYETTEGWEIAGPFLYVEMDSASDEYVFLMPFEEIQQIFREMIQKKYSDFVQAGIDMKFQVEEIRLGYMRIMEKGNPTEGTIVPVLGISWNKDKEPYQFRRPYTETFGGPFESFLNH